MNYPTIEQIETADRIQISRWYRFLPSPGISALGKDNFLDVCHNEALLMEKINTRFEDFGGMTPEISKIISFK